MPRDARSSRRLNLVLVATALCYLIGYPLALVAHSPVGWGFVALGGPFLLALFAMVIRRVHESSGNTPGSSRAVAEDQPPR